MLVYATLNFLDQVSGYARIFECVVINPLYALIKNWSKDYLLNQYIMLNLTRNQLISNVIQRREVI